MKPYCKFTSVKSLHLFEYFKSIQQITGYNLPASEVCNISSSCGNVAEFRSEFKAQLQLQVSAPITVVNDKLASSLSTDKSADAHVNSARGKQQLNCAKYRFDKENNDTSEVIDGLPKYVRELEGFKFYDEELNAGLKWNTVFYWDSPEMHKLLEESKKYSFDCTFCVDSSTGLQLAVMIAVIEMHDPTRESIIVSFLFSFMKSKCTDAYCEYFQARDHIV